jgi:hypothetical protein
MAQAAHAQSLELFGSNLVRRQLTEQLRMSYLVGMRWSELMGPNLVAKQLNEQLRMSNLVGMRWSELMGAGLVTKQLSDQLRSTSLAAKRWSEVAGSTQTARAWAELARSLASVTDTTHLRHDSRPHDAEDRSLSAFAAWYLALPPKHRRAILNSLLGVLLSTCLVVQAVVPHRAPPVITHAMELVLSILILCSAISDASGE